MKEKLYSTFKLSICPSEINDPFDAVYWYDHLDIEFDYKAKDYVNNYFKSYYKGFETSLSLLDTYSDFVDATYNEITKQHTDYKSFSGGIHPLNILIAKHFINQIEKHKDLSDTINDCVKELNEMIEKGLINEEEFYC